MAIDFLAIGHMTHDRTENGFRLGGTVSYAAVTALRLERRPGVLTRGALLGGDGLPPPLPGESDGRNRQLPAGVALHVAPSDVSTTFSNLYEGGRRRQIIESLAAPIGVDELPAEWAQAPVVLLGPVAREVPSDWTAAFPNALMGITPQGWLRRWDAAGNVSPTRWDDPGPFLQRADVVILSREDVGGDDAYLAELAGQTRLLVVTDGWHGASLHQSGMIQPISPRPAREIDPTGAGDVFATAFLIRLAETGDPSLAARFATTVASMSVEAAGVDAIPTRAQVERSLADES